MVNYYGLLNQLYVKPCVVSDISFICYVAEDSSIPERQTDLTPSPASHLLYSQGKTDKHEQSVIFTVSSILKHPF